MLWTRHGFRLKPMTSMKEICSQYLESPGTKAYSILEARELFREFTTVDAEVVLNTRRSLELRRRSETSWFVSQGRSADLALVGYSHILQEIWTLHLITATK
jgi:hypothetical protein